MATRLGSGKARAALTFILFLAIWLLLSIPDAFAATVTRASSFTYGTDGLLLTETVEPGDPQIGVKTTYVYDAFGNKTSATTANIAGAAGNAIIASRRGQILGFDTREGWDGWDVVRAKMPESEIGDLIIEVRSGTAGVGSFTFKFDHMAELSGKTADQIVAARRAAERYLLVTSPPGFAETRVREVLR